MSLRKSLPEHTKLKTEAVQLKENLTKSTDDVNIKEQFSQEKINTLTADLAKCQEIKSLPPPPLPPSASSIKTTRGGF